MLTSAAFSTPLVLIQTGNLPAGGATLTFGMPGPHHHNIPLQPNTQDTQDLLTAPLGAFVTDAHNNVDFCTREDGTGADHTDFSDPQFMLYITDVPGQGISCKLSKGG